MEINDALTITILGISVVFTGLILTSLLIFSFSRVPGLFSKKPAGSKEKPASPGRENRADEVPPDVLAVLTAVIEVEQRLHHVHQGHRLTITQPVHSDGWAHTTRMREYPVKGGNGR